MQMIKIVKGVYWIRKDENNITVMIENEIGKDFSIADIYVGDEEQSKEHLDNLALEVAYELDYRLADMYE